LKKEGSAMALDAMIFDIDGTLVDTGSGRGLIVSS
jgi:hypothetical protein